MPKFVDTSPPGQCIFCRIASGELPAAKVYEDEQTLAFMDLGQVNPGHVLVATRRHAATLYDLDAGQAEAVMRTARRVALAVREAFDPPGLNLFQANGPEAGQTVFHFHMHVLPRLGDDGVALSWPRKEPPVQQLQDYAARLRETLR